MEQPKEAVPRQAIPAAPTQHESMLWEALAHPAYQSILGPRGAQLRIPALYNWLDGVEVVIADASAVRLGLRDLCPPTPGLNNTPYEEAGQSVVYASL